MNRREFLSGLLGTAVVASLPASAALLEPVTLDWQGALSEVCAEYMQEFIIFGTAGLRTIDEFPYIKVVTAQEIYLLPELTRSEGKF